MLRRRHPDLERLSRRLERPAAPVPKPRAPAPFSGTGIERQVAAWLDELGVDYVAQHALLPGATVDFYVPAASLVIECQGTWYHGDPAEYAAGRLTAAQRRKRRQDAALERLAQRAGLTLLALWEAELGAQPERCRRRLAAALGLAGPEEEPMSERICATTLPEGIVLAVHHGDLTAEDVEVIVNAANSQLAHGGGVAGAIARRGGPTVQAESDAYVREHGPVPPGGAALTGAGDLPCRAVIHAVGPVWNGGQRGEPTQLRSAVTRALEIAGEQGFGSLAMPAISSGIFGFPKSLCAEILIDAAVIHASRHAAGSLREIRFTNFDQPTVAVFVNEFRRRFSDPEA